MGGSAERRPTKWIVRRYFFPVRFSFMFWR
jgi:hypothetical protein